MISVNGLKLWEIELDRVDWARLRDVRAGLRDAFVGAEYVPAAIRGLLNATSPQEVEKQYWQLENHVVVQGATFEAAEYVVSVLICALREPLTDFVMPSILELLFQMTAYYCADERVDGDLTERCRARAREGLRRLYEIFMQEKGDDDAALILLAKIESDPNRLNSFIEAKMKTGWVRPAFSFKI